MGLLGAFFGILIVDKTKYNKWTGRSLVVGIHLSARYIHGIQ